MKWRTDKPDEGKRVIVYMPAYTRRASGSGHRFPVKESVGVGEWWNDQPEGQPDGVWFFRKAGNVIVGRPVSHWMPLPMPDEEMSAASSALVAEVKSDNKAKRDAWREQNEQAQA